MRAGDGHAGAGRGRARGARGAQPARQHDVDGGRGGRRHGAGRRPGVGAGRAGRARRRGGRRAAGGPRPGSPPTPTTTTCSGIPISATSRGTRAPRPCGWRTTTAPSWSPPSGPPGRPSSRRSSARCRRAPRSCRSTACAVEVIGHDGARSRPRRALAARAPRAAGRGHAQRPRVAAALRPRRPGRLPGRAWTCWRPTSRRRACWCRGTAPRPSGPSHGSTPTAATSTRCSPASTRPIRGAEHPGMADVHERVRRLAAGD